MRSKFSIITSDFGSQGSAGCQSCHTCYTGGKNAWKDEGQRGVEGFLGAIILAYFKCWSSLYVGFVFSKGIPVKISVYNARCFLYMTLKYLHLIWLDERWRIPALFLSAFPCFHHPDFSPWEKWDLRPADPENWSPETSPFEGFLDQFHEFVSCSGRGIILLTSPMSCTLPFVVFPVCTTQFFVVYFCFICPLIYQFGDCYPLCSPKV